MNPERITVKRAFVSVSDRTGLAAFASLLVKSGVEVYATGGTASYLRDNGVPVRPAQEVTGVVEMLSGKVKSLSPRLHAAILFNRSDPGERAHIESQGLPPIDMVVVNFYPFQKVKAEDPAEEAVSLIDIGGPAALRAAAKNFAWVVPVPEPAAYELVMADASRPGGGAGETEGEGGLKVSRALSARLAARVFEITSSYDRLVAAYLAGTRGELRRPEPAAAEEPRGLPQTIELKLSKSMNLRYGENPHQKASFYLTAAEEAGGPALGRQLQGKELSFNNLLDLDAAVSACREFEEPACVVIKHRNPSGVAVSRDVLAAYRLARDCDSLSAFGGVVAVNRAVTPEAAQEMAGLFLEVLAAPGYEPDGVKAFSKKKNLRLLELPTGLFQRSDPPRVILRSGLVGLLAEEEDSLPDSPTDWRVVSKRQPSRSELAGLFFAWRVARHAISNSIVISRAGEGGDEYATVGIGAGQTSRVDAVQAALYKAGRSGHEVRGACMASDGFFPFRDSIDAAAGAGLAAVVEPGGSVRDAECIQAADEHGMVLCFTGRRCFKH